MGVSGAIRHTTVLKTVRQCKSHWIYTMNLILGESLLAIKLNLIMMSLWPCPHPFYKWREKRSSESLQKLQQFPLWIWSHTLMHLRSSQLPERLQESYTTSKLKLGLLSVGEQCCYNKLFTSSSWCLLFSRTYNHSHRLVLVAECMYYVQWTLDYQNLNYPADRIIWIAFLNSHHACVWFQTQRLVLQVNPKKVSSAIESFMIQLWREWPCEGSRTGRTVNLVESGLWLFATSWRTRLAN